jgi:uncharacterized membrane protein YccC
MDSSVRIQEAIKTALALIIAYAISMEMGWSKLAWAGLAIGMTAIPGGMSFNKAILRMLGTVCAVSVCFFLLGNFIQSRWLFIAVLSGFVGVCTYNFMQDVKYSYFWLVSAFTSVIISFFGANMGVVDPASYFNLGMLRAQETGLGIMVYALISLLLWPINSYKRLQGAQQQLIRQAERCFGQHWAMLTGAKIDDDMRDNVSALQAATNQFNDVLRAAVIDSARVTEQKQHWQMFAEQTGHLQDLFARWYQYALDVRELSLSELFRQPELEQQFVQRLGMVNRLLDGEVLPPAGEALSFSLDNEAVAKLTLFQQTTLHSMSTLLEEVSATVERLLRLSVVLSPAEQPSQDETEAELARTAPAKPVKQRFFLPDIEALTAGMQAALRIWLSFLVLIYFPELVGGSPMLIVMATSIGMSASLMPQISLVKIGMIVLSMVLVATTIYVGILPALTDYWQLALLLFVLVFAICYQFYRPADSAIRLIAMAMLVSVISVTNPQSYNFVSILLIIVAICMALLLIFFVLNIPFSNRPERVFVRMMRRYFRRSYQLLSLPHERPDGWGGYWWHWQQSYCLYELRTLPIKMMPWSRCLPPDLTQGNPARFGSVLLILQGFTRDLELLSSARHDWYFGQRSPFNRHLRQWRQALLERVGHLARVSLVEVDNADVFEQTLKQIEQRADRDMASHATSYSESQRQQFYTLTSALRGVTQLLAYYSTQMQGVDTARWREARF